MERDYFNFTRRLRILCIFSIILSIAFLSACYKPLNIPQNRGLRVSFIDVGQGDSILIEFDGGDKVLIDGGEKNGNALSFLKASGTEQIDTIIATHPHSDHIGGLIEILRNIPVKNIYTNEDIHTTPIFEEFLNAAEKANLGIWTVKGGDKIEAKGILNFILSPKLDELPKDAFILLYNKSVLVELYNFTIRLNCKSEYYKDEKKILIEKENKRIEMWVDKVRVRINGEEKRLLQPPILLGKKVLIPLEIVKFLGGDFSSSYDVKELKMFYKEKEYKISPDYSTLLLLIANGKVVIYGVLKFVVEMLGAKVEWDAKEQKITIIVDENKIEMWIDKLEIKINGKMLKLDVPPLIINNRMIIPINSILEAIGGNVEINLDIKNLKAWVPKTYYFEVLNPPAKLFEDINNNSLVLKLDYYDISFLFSGDVEREAEKDMINKGLNLKATILKLGHHGSATSSTPKYLNAVSPEVAIYMAGKDNVYGHPDKEVIERLNQMGVKVYGTSVNGSICITTDGKSYLVATER